MNVSLNFTQALRLKLCETLEGVEDADCRGAAGSDEEKGKWNPTKDLVGGDFLIGQAGFVFAIHEGQITEAAKLFLVSSVSDHKSDYLTYMRSGLDTQRSVHDMLASMSTLTPAQNTVGRGMAIMLLLTGTSHFIVPGPVDQLVPSFLPGDSRSWTYLSGVAEIVIALMLLAPLGKKFAGKSIRLWGAYSAFALFVALFPANINMAIQWSSRDMPEPLFAYARLPLQLGLFYWAWALAKDIKIKSSQLI